VSQRVSIEKRKSITQTKKNMSERSKKSSLQFNNKGLFTIKPHILEHNNQLIELDVSNNQISSLPNEITLLKNLKVLRIDHNKFTQLNDSIFTII